MDKLLDIKLVANKLNLKDENIYCYGHDKAKINFDYENNKNNNGKLILVTSINPTPFGEGKTTLSIGLTDSLCKIKKNALLTLREPSLGPVFGIKGGAIGGGKSKVEPSIDINLHFTGDFHAVTSANNLLCAIVDNHIFQGNELRIDKVTIKRCLDINDRSLREIKLNNRNEKFVITPASEIMAVLCLCKNLDDLKERIGNITVGYTKENKAIYAKDLKAENAVTILLKDAIKPNLVQTLYNNPVIIHGGPFANIAHGCCSLISIKTALKLSDYVITEAGFGSDMGAIKFFDILCKDNNIYPDTVIINCTIRALKYNGNNKLEDGICNLKYHIDNMKKYCDNIVVALNKFDTDLDEEVEYIKKYCKNNNTEFSVCTMYQDGEDGCIDLANKIINLKPNTKRYFIYNDNEKLIDKINKISKEFNARKILCNDKIKNMIKVLNDSKLKICISKTPMSISDNKNNLGYPKDFNMEITDVNIYSGAGFIVLLMGNIITMPGLSKNSNYLNMYIDNNKIEGIM